MAVSDAPKRASGAPNKNWTLTTAVFEKLLERLDPDRERAGVAYERIRQKLFKFFQWRGCPFPEEYTDRTIDRVARRIDEGSILHIEDLYLYFHGVALNVLREQRREAETVPLSGDALSAPATAREVEWERQEREWRLECLEECLRQIAPESRRLVILYHQGFRRAKIDARQQLAEELQIPLNALRIRMYRIRASLAKSVTSCLQSRLAADTDLKSGH
jgi:DNA-directed RNA polymerase specialized sigma24 family protein